MKNLRILPVIATMLLLVGCSLFQKQNQASSSQGGEPPTTEATAVPAAAPAQPEVTVVPVATAYTQQDAPVQVDSAQAAQPAQAQAQPAPVQPTEVPYNGPTCYNSDGAEIRNATCKGVFNHKNGVIVSLIQSDDPNCSRVAVVNATTHSQGNIPPTSNAASLGCVPADAVLQQRSSGTIVVHYSDGGDFIVYT